jgi:hypothetical protein
LNKSGSALENLPRRAPILRHCKLRFPICREPVCVFRYAASPFSFAFYQEHTLFCPYRQMRSAKPSDRVLRSPHGERSGFLKKPDREAADRQGTGGEHKIARLCLISAVLHFATALLHSKTALLHFETALFYFGFGQLYFAERQLCFVARQLHLATRQLHFVARQLYDKTA